MYIVRAATTRSMITKAPTVANPGSPVTQISWCTSPIFHNAPFCDRNVHISVTNGALWDICPMRCGICEKGLLWSLS